MTSDGCSAQPDQVAIADMLFYPLMPSDPGRSLLAGIDRHPGLGVTDALRDAVASSSRSRGADECAQRVSDALESAVSDSCAKRKAVGVLSTGGLDSAVVAAITRRVTGTPPVLLSVGGGLSSPREVLLQQELARFMGAETVVLDTLPTFTAEPILRVNRGRDFPAGGVFTHIWDAAVDEAIKCGLTLLLTGEGGNEVFGSGPGLARDLLGSGRVVAALQTVGRSRAADDPGAVSQLVRLRGERTLPRTARADPGSALTRWRGRYAKDLPEATRRRRRQVTALRATGASYADVAATLWLERVDSYAALDSRGRIPVASPLADPRVLSAAAACHPAARNPVAVGCQDKHLLRLVARQWLPASISEAGKVGVANQFGIALRGADFGAVRERLGASAQWLGIDLNESFFTPETLPAGMQLDWSRMLALAAWGDNAITTHESPV